MTTDLALLEQALQDLTMDVVINLTEHVQTLELRPNGQLFTAYREIDRTILIGYSENLVTDQLSLKQRHFFITGNRRGTKREHRLLLHTLKDLNIHETYNESCFVSSCYLVQQLIKLSWPVGDLDTIAIQTLHQQIYE